MLRNFLAVLESVPSYTGWCGILALLCGGCKGMRMPVGDSAVFYGSLI